MSIDVYVVGGNYEERMKCRAKKYRVPDDHGMRVASLADPGEERDVFYTSGISPVFGEDGSLHFRSGHDSTCSNNTLFEHKELFFHLAGMGGGRLPRDAESLDPRHYHTEWFVPPPKEGECRISLSGDHDSYRVVLAEGSVVVVGGYVDHRNDRGHYSPGYYPISFARCGRFNSGHRNECHPFDEFGIRETGLFEIVDGVPHHLAAVRYPRRGAIDTVRLAANLAKSGLKEELLKRADEVQISSAGSIYLRVERYKKVTKTSWASDTKDVCQVRISDHPRKGELPATVEEVDWHPGVDILDHLKKWRVGFLRERKAQLVHVTTGYPHPLLTAFRKLDKKYLEEVEEQLAELLA